VLGFFLSNKTDKAGVLPLPTFHEKSLADKGWIFPHHLATGYSGNIERLQKQAAAAGHLYPALDRDGVTRRVPIFMKYGDDYYEAISFAITRDVAGQRAGQDPGAAAQDGNDRERYRGCRSATSASRWTRRWRARSLSRPKGMFRYVSATDVIHGTTPVEELRDKIVIVGTSAQGILDLRPTPVQEDFPGWRSTPT
jgi:adenylate cyclase